MRFRINQSVIALHSLLVSGWRMNAISKWHYSSYGRGINILSVCDVTKIPHKVEWWALVSDVQKIAFWIRGQTGQFLSQWRGITEIHVAVSSVSRWACHTLLEIRVLQGFFTNTYNKPYPMGFFTLWKKPAWRFFGKTFRGFSQREEPYRVGFLICVGEKPLNDLYF
jgi:hypothetical protein